MLKASSSQRGVVAVCLDSGGWNDSTSHREHCPQRKTEWSFFFAPPLAARQNANVPVLFGLGGVDGDSAVDLFPIGG